MTEHQSAAAILLDAARNFEKDMHEKEDFSHKISLKTKRVIRVSIAFLTLFTILTAFSIYSLAGFLEETVTHMETMYKNFGTVTEEMRSMTHSITKMENNISGIDAIAVDISSMRRNIAAMERDMVLMDREIIYFNQDVQQIQQDMAEMSTLFDSVNKSVEGMLNDADEMSRMSNAVPVP